MKKSFWVIIFLAIILVVFSVQNAQDVEIYFLAWRGHISLALLLICTFVFGVLVASLYAVFSKKDTKSKDDDRSVEEDKHPDTVQNNMNE